MNWVEIVTDNVFLYKVDRFIVTFIKGVVEKDSVVLEVESIKVVRIWVISVVNIVVMGIEKIMLQEVSV